MHEHLDAAESFTRALEEARGSDKKGSFLSSSLHRRQHKRFGGKRLGIMGALFAALSLIGYGVVKARRTTNETTHSEAA